MLSPFPGMDPYLEAPLLWPDVHNSLAFAIREQLQQTLSPRYTAVITPYAAYEMLEISTRRYVVPDVAIVGQGSAEHAQSNGEPHTAAGSSAVAIAPAPVTGVLEVETRYARVEIRTVGDEVLVAVIELLSPANKRPGATGADAYALKRRDLLATSAHLLEIDLLRAGQRPPLATPLPPAAYCITLSRAEARPHVDLWPLALRDPLPVVPVPLLAGDADVPLDLARALHHVYRSARYERRIDYRAPPSPPPLAPNDAAWLDARLREAGAR